MRKGVLLLVLATSVATSQAQSEAPHSAPAVMHTGHQSLPCKGSDVRDILIDVRVDGVYVDPPTRDVCRGDTIKWTIKNCNYPECGPAWVKVANRHWYSGSSCENKPPDDFMAKWFLFFSCDFDKVVKRGQQQTVECKVKDDACDTYKYDVLAEVTREYKIEGRADPGNAATASDAYVADPEVEVQGPYFPPPKMRPAPAAIPRSPGSSDGTSGVAPSSRH